ncbi:MAG: universal stress protein UspA [Caulobacteraceae bacterium]|nr:universal stress protein UspA [Caulobacteraceae bacterium]
MKGAQPAVGEMVQATSLHNATAFAGYRDLLVHVEPGALAGRRLEAAIDLARRFQAVLIGVGAETVEPYSIDDPCIAMGGELAAVAQAVVIDDLCDAETLFKARTPDLDSRWLAMQCRPIDALTALARSADLIVAGGNSPEQASARCADTAELLLRAGRPVLVVPSHGRRFRGEAAVVAWKDRREARRAVNDALPILRTTEIVLVVEVCRADEIPEAEERAGAVAEHLRRHGIEAAARAIASSGDPAKDVRRTAHSIGADLIVAGAYGRARLNERMFGGFTDEMLRRPEHFLLMSH